VVWATAAAAQTGTPLTLADAIARARATHPDAAAAVAAEQAATRAATQARAGYLPTVDLIESWQRGNQPVFVFSSLLSQRRFTAANFAIDALNHPDAINNFRTALTIDQPIYNGAVSAATTSAAVGVRLAAAGRQLVGQQLATAVTDAYGRVLAAEGARTAANAAVEAATADRELVTNRRNAGAATDADVLQVELLVARAEQQRIQAGADLRIARAGLAALVGAPLDEAFALAMAAPGAAAPSDLAAMQDEAVKQRPDVASARLQVELAGAKVSEARSSFLPQVGVQAGWEGNGDVWTSRAGSWMVGASARINLFRGRSDQSRLGAANDVLMVRKQELARTETRARVDVIAASARLDAARASGRVARAALAQARESHRIIRDRYEAGLADIAALLRAAEAMAQADSQVSAADAAVLTTHAALEQALGRL
jgi:outer membrane protein TolC